MRFTTDDPAAATNLNKGSFRKHHIANQTAADLKKAAYSGTFDANLLNFQPIAIETSGRWTSDLYSVFNRIKKYLIATCAVISSNNTRRSSLTGRKILLSALLNGKPDVLPLS